MDELGLSGANVNSHATLYRSGFPVDTFPRMELSLADCAPLIAPMQHYLVMLN